MTLPENPSPQSRAALLLEVAEFPPDHSAAGALVVLSGGQDSTLLLSMVCALYERVHAITFDYGQRHRREIEAATKVAAMARVEAHQVVTVPALRGTSPLTNLAEDLEQYKDYDSMTSIIGTRIEKTFVPMRNALFLTLAANYAAAEGLTYVFTGVCEEDGANYPDCRATFIKSMNDMVAEALGGSAVVRIKAPLIHLRKSEALRLFAANDEEALRLLAYSHTAYDGSYPPTGADHATLLRARSFEEAELPDPLILRAYWEGLLPSLPTTQNYSDPDVLAGYARLLGSFGDDQRTPRADS